MNDYDADLQKRFLKRFGEIPKIFWKGTKQGCRFYVSYRGEIIKADGFWPSANHATAAGSAFRRDFMEAKLREEQS